MSNLGGIKQAQLSCSPVCWTAALHPPPSAHRGLTGLSRWKSQCCHYTSFPASSTSLHDSSGDMEEEAPATAPSLAPITPHLKSSFSEFSESLTATPWIYCGLCTLPHGHVAHFPFNSESQFHHQRVVSRLFSKHQIF